MGPNRLRRYGVSLSGTCMVEVTGNISRQNTGLLAFYYNDYGMMYLKLKLQLIFWNNKNQFIYTELFKIIVGVLTTCNTQYTSDSSIRIFLFNRTTLQVFVTHLTGALYMHPLWFYKHQHDNRVRSKLFVACQRWWFQWRFWFVPSVAGYTRTLSLETVHTNCEWNCQMVVVSRIWCGIAAGQLYLDNRFE